VTIWGPRDLPNQVPSQHASRSSLPVSSTRHPRPGTFSLVDKCPDSDAWTHPLVKRNLWHSPSVDHRTSRLLTPFQGLVPTTRHSNKPSKQPCLEALDNRLTLSRPSQSAVLSTACLGLSRLFQSTSLPDRPIVRCTTFDPRPRD